MKHLIALVVAVTVLGAFTFVHAGPRFGQGGANGTVGTIDDVGSSGFTMNTEAGKSYKVLCNSMTKFVEGEKTNAASDIKVGVRVKVEGGVSGSDQIMANTVTILPAKGKKKSE